MIQQLLIFVIKILIGTTLGIAGIYTAKRKKKMRIFETFTSDVQIDILETAIAYAKADIAENNLQVDLIEHACGYGEMFFLQPQDFAIIDCFPVVGWVGGRPVHRPRTW